LTPGHLMESCLFCREQFKVPRQLDKCEIIQPVEPAMPPEKVAKGFVLGPLVYEAQNGCHPSFLGQFPPGVSVNDQPVLRHDNGILESTVSQPIECIDFASRDGKLMLKVTGMRVEFIQTAGYELAGNVIQCSSRLAPLLFFSLQSTDRRFCGLCRGHSRVTTQIGLAANFVDAGLCEANTASAQLGPTWVQNWV